MHIQNTFHQGQVEGGRWQVLIGVFRQKNWTVGVPCVELDNIEQSGPLCVQLDSSGVGLRYSQVRSGSNFSLASATKYQGCSVRYSFVTLQNKTIEFKLVIYSGTHLSISWLSENILSGEATRFRTSSWFVQSTWAFKFTNNEEDWRQKAPKMVKASII